jgi:hypothetical protein
MTIAEAHQEFKFRLDKLDALNYPSFLPEEIDLILNNAQQRIVKQRYGPTNNKRQSFEETEKRTNDLKNVTVNAVLTPLAYAPDNIDISARFLTLPTDHWFTVQERCNITCTICGSPLTQLVEVIPTSHSEFSKVIKDPFKKPTENKVLRLMEAGRVELLSSCTIVDYRMRYIKQPDTVNITTGVTFELSEHMHSEIVDEGVKIALEAIEGKRTQSFNPLINNTNE